MILVASFLGSKRKSPLSPLTAELSKVSESYLALISIARMSIRQKPIDDTLFDETHPDSIGSSNLETQVKSLDYQFVQTLLMPKAPISQLTSGLGLVVLGVALGVLGCVVYWNLTTDTNSSELAQSDPLEGTSAKEESSSLTNPPRSNVEQTEAFDSTHTQSDSTTDSDPRSAWITLLNDEEEDIAQLDTFLAVTSAWASRDGLKVIDRVRESLGFSVVANAVVLSVLHQAVQTDPHAAFQSAIYLSSQSRKDALSSIVGLWAQTDPIAALEALNSANLGGSRNDLFESLIDAWSESNPKNLLASLAEIPERLREKAEQQGMFGVARTSPPDAVEFLSELPDDPNDDRRYDLAFEIAEHWSKIDVHAALDWVSSIPFPGESNKRPQRMLLSKVLSNLAREDPNLALQAALNDPMGKFGYGLEPFVVSSTAQVDTDQAISMLSRVREGTTKAASYRSVGRALANQGNFDRAIDLGLSLPDDQQSNYYCAVFSRWARSDPDSLFKSMDRMPSSHVKAQAAYNLLARYRNSGVLNDDEVESLQGIVNASEHAITSVATYTDSFVGSQYDREAAILRRELESHGADGAPIVFEVSEN